jgi:hypothetical protein
MKHCPSQTREALAGLLYGELPPAEAEAVQKHLAGCSACRAEYAALRHVRAALDAAPEPVEPPGVDLARLYREAARRQARRLRRWRRLAVAALAAAAALLVAFGLKLEVRLERHQLVLRWGNAEAEAPRPVPQPPVAQHAPPERDAEMQLVKELIHLLAEDVKSRDGRQQEALLALQERLDALGVQVNERWAATERDVAALYTAQFGSRDKGDKP